MNDQAKLYQQLIAKCWADEAFKHSLMANPREVLKQEGMEIPEGVSVQVLENTPQHIVIVLPQAPEDLSDAELGSVAGGAPLTSMMLHLDLIVHGVPEM